MNVGISVSRVGGAAQVKAMRSVAGRLRLDLAQYRELEAFSQFGSELDAATQKQLARGERIVEVLKQPQYAPTPVEQQIMIIYAVTNGHLDDIPANRIRAFEYGFHEYASTQRPGIGEAIRKSGKLDEDTTQQLVEAVKAYKEIFGADAAAGGARRAAPPAGKEPANTAQSTPANPLA